MALVEVVSELIRPLRQKFQMKMAARLGGVLLIGVIVCPAGVAVSQEFDAKRFVATASNNLPAALTSEQRLNYWDKALGIVDKAVKIAALIVRAAFAYFKFFRGRVFRPRLEPSVSGTLAEKDGSRYLIATAKVKNVGLSKCAIRQEGSGVRISGYEHGGWKVIKAVDILTQHQWIESAETVSDDVLFVLNNRQDIAYRLELRLVSKETRWVWRGGQWLPRRLRLSWFTQAIVGAGSMNGNTVKRKGIMDLVHAAIGG